MNESMNFGNLGFSTVTEEKVDDTPAFAKKDDETVTQQDKPAEENVEEAKDEKVDVEEIKKKDAEAASDFEQSSAAQNLKNYEEDAANFQNIDFGPMQKYLDDDDITDISYSNGGQLWLKSLSKGVYRADQQEVDDALMEKIAFQCSNIMGKTFNMAHPFLDSESAELRMNFVHNSIARNGIAVVFRKTPAKIRLEKQKLLNEKYIQLNIHDFLINCVHAHCNIIVCGETGSGKTELVKYLASHTLENEKLISIEDTLELHLDRIYPTRDIVAMKTNNIASYSDVLVTCMRQNPIWILLSEVRSAEAVTAVRNSISSGHYILSTIHADKAESIPHRMYSLLESNIDVEQFLKTIYRYVQIGVFVRGRYKPEVGRFVREIAGVCEFHVTDDEKAEFTNIYLKNVQGEETFTQPSKYFLRFMEGAGIDLKNLFGENKANVTDGMDMSQIKSPTVNIMDDNNASNNNENTQETNTATEEPKEQPVEEQKVEEQKPEEKIDLVSPTVQPSTENITPTEVQTPEPVQTVAPLVQETVAQEIPVETQTEEVQQPVQEPVQPVVPVEQVEEVKQEETTQPEVQVQAQIEPQPVQEPTPELVQQENTPVGAPAPVQEVPIEGPKVEGTTQVQIETPVEENKSLMEIANGDNKVEEPKQDDVNVTVQEAIPDVTPTTETVASPDDIVAKPMIDLATLQNNAAETPVLDLTQNAAQQNINQQPVVDNNVPTMSAPVAQPPVQQPVDPTQNAVQTQMVQQPVQPVMLQPMAPVQEMMPNQQTVQDLTGTLSQIQPNQQQLMPLQQPPVDSNALQNQMVQPNVMMTNGVPNMGVPPVDSAPINPVGVPIQNNGQNLSVNVESPLGFMNNNISPALQPVPQQVAVNQMGVNPAGNQFIM